MQQESFSITKRIKSFGYAFNGLKVLVIEEHNSRVHISASILVIILGVYFKINLIEWLFIVASIGAVISMEAINSALEGIADFISPDYHELIKKIKDLAAASVLVSALATFLIGLIIFIPKFMNLFLDL
jgi:undecaprenol kinase/diacylglycerol kinase (ATP)